MSNSKKYLRRLQELEDMRQEKIAHSHKEGNYTRKKVSKYKGKDLKTQLSQKEIDRWVSDKTGISPTTGNKQDRISGRTKGRFLKGKL